MSCIRKAAASIFFNHKFITGRIGLLRERTGLGTGFANGVSFVFKLCVFDRLLTGCVGGGAGGTQKSLQCVAIRVHVFDNFCK